MIEILKLSRPESNWSLGLFLLDRIVFGNRVDVSPALLSGIIRTRMWHKLNARRLWGWRQTLCDWIPPTGRVVNSTNFSVDLTISVAAYRYTDLYKASTIYLSFTQHVQNDEAIVLMCQIFESYHSSLKCRGLVEMKPLRQYIGSTTRKQPKVNVSPLQKHMVT